MIGVVVALELLAVSSLWMAFKREAARQDLIVSVVLGDTETTS